MSTEPSNKKQKTSPSGPSRVGRPPSTPTIESLMEQEDLWVDNILPCFGIGQYAFLGAVNKKLNQLYKDFCKTVKKPRRVFTTERQITTRAATATDTLYSAAFCNESCAEYWFADSSEGKTPRPSAVCQAIAGVGSLPVLTWAHNTKGFPMSMGTCKNAASAGHLEILKWARENGCPWDWRTCRRAAGYGHLEVLKWARENGCPWDDYTCSQAAKTGHLEILKWARENGCPWNERTCYNAANGGHLEVLKWARENGAMGDSDTCSEAAEMAIWRS
ncbi:ankyrin repeat protein [Seminavis robusta]|uniref:Ankyrin repeat protein n=1 Tax=Seminavis robusta TaxID=568900 RepID=A0A9N8EYT9_9STRA|nr:ankyrin repeat protein [Seminavis robusta]|eukprot:Sro2143_g316260.1 ankyrin repeat protein (275) ;mRNA; r:16446-17270